MTSYPACQSKPASRPTLNASARDCDGTGGRTRAIPGGAGGGALAGESGAVAPSASAGGTCRARAYVRGLRENLLHVTRSFYYPPW